MAENAALRQAREAAETRAGQLKARVEELREQIRQQLASYPPEAFEAQKARPALTLALTLTQP